MCAAVRKDYGKNVREGQFNVSEFKQFKIATHESSVSYQETSCDRRLFQDLVQKFLLQLDNQVKVETQEKDSNDVHSPGLSLEPTASSAEGVTSQSSSDRPSFFQEVQIRFLWGGKHGPIWHFCVFPHVFQCFGGDLVGKPGPIWQKSSFYRVLQ